MSSNIDKIIWKHKPFKHLIFNLNTKGGRNSFGRITSFKKGGRKKRKYRIIDFKRNIFNIPAIIRRIEYDPNRSAFIALVCYKNGIISYVVLTEGLNIGDVILNYWDSKHIEIKEHYNLKSGNNYNLNVLPIGSIINNVELTPGKGAQLARSAGTFCILSLKYKIFNKDFAVLRLNSGVEYLVSANCRANIGIVSNIKHRFKIKGKAGVSRNLGIRPVVRGVAMNPIDHPHGGGEGKKSGRRLAMSPWGKISKGFKTRKRNNKTNKFIIKFRHG